MLINIISTTETLEEFGVDLCGEGGRIGVLNKRICIIFTIHTKKNLEIYFL